MSRMLRDRMNLSMALVLALSLAPAAGSPSPAGPAPPAGDILPEVRKGIEAALRTKVAAIHQEKNKEGLPYKRANYSRSFKKVDESTYQVGLHVDTAHLEDMLTERYTVTVKRTSDDTWSVTDLDLEESYTALYRAVRTNRECGRFEKFSFAREGLKVTATNGSFCMGYLNKKPAGFRFTASDLAFDYAPPEDGMKEWTLHRVLRKEREADLVFTPDYALILCDPESCEDLGAAFPRAVQAAGEQTGGTGGSLDHVDAALRKIMEENDREAEKNLKENPFSGFRRLYEPDRTYYGFSLVKKGSTDDSFYFEHDSYEPKEISVWASKVFSFLPLYRYYSEETRNSDIPPYELELRPDASARDYDLVSLQGSVEMGFGDGETLIGDVTYGLTTKQRLRELPFSIARIFQTEEKKERKNPKMIINSLQDGEGRELTWVRHGPYSGLVILPQEVPAGTPLTLRLQFENRDSIYHLTSTFSYVDRGGWLPFVRLDDMIDKFDLTVKVPARYKTLGVGRMASESKANGVSTSRWVSDHPVSFPSVVYGQYHEDDSRVKVAKSDGTTVPVTIHIDKGSLMDSALVGEIREVTDGQLQLASYAELKISTRVVRDYAAKAANALNLYMKIYGVDYPFAKLDLVNDPLGGFYGQAPSSLIYLGNPDFWSEGVVSGYLEEGSSLSTFKDSVVPHEVAHQFWGSLICNANDGNYWFVESLAEYSSALFTEAAEGKEKYREHVEAWRKEILEADMRNSVQDGYTTWAGPGGFRSYRAALYAKGPYTFHIMRMTWGDEAFFKFLKDLAQELKGKQIVTRDIQRIAEKSLGVSNLDWFFDQWLRGIGLPEFTFNYTSRTAEDGTQMIEGEVVQRVMLKPAVSVREALEGKLFRGIIPITVVGKSGKEYRKKLIIEAERTPFKFSLPEKPKEIVFNKYGEALAYDVKASDKS